MTTQFIDLETLKANVAVARAADKAARPYHEGRDPPMKPGTTSIIPARYLTFLTAGGAERAFIQENHYSRKCPPFAYAFRATGDGGAMLGACTFRRPSLPGIEKCYGATLELNRLVLVDEAGKNSESRFIGWCLRWLARHTEHRRVVSFADPHVGHVGTVYRASNWKYAGLERGHGTRIIRVDGEEMHSKTAYDRWGCSGKKLADLLPNSKVEVIVREPKHVYTYDLRR